MNSIQRKQGGANVRIPPPLVFLAGMAIGWTLDNYIRPWRIPMSQATGLVMAVGTGLVGLFLIVSPLVLFKRTGQDPEPWKPSPELIGRGPYQFSRNPMYLGMMLLQSAVGLGLDSFWIVVLAPLSLLAVHFAAVLPEERYLASRFGDHYSNYMARTARYLGWPKAPPSNSAD